MLIITEQFLNEPSPVENNRQLLLGILKLYVLLSNNGKSMKDKIEGQKSELGNHLRNLRKGKGETLHKVSMGTDIDSPMLSKIERGERLPTLDQLKKLSKYFKVQESDLKVMHTAEKIIKEYGANDTTYDAIRIIENQLTPYKKNKAK